MSALIARLVDCSSIVADLILLVFDPQTTEVFAISVLREEAIGLIASLGRSNREH